MITITSKANVHFLPNRGRFTLYGAPINITPGSRFRDSFLVPATGSVNDIYGLSFKSLGYGDIPILEQQPHAPEINRWYLPGGSGLIKATLNVNGAQLDPETAGATASCVTFQLNPDQVAALPYIAEGARTSKISEIAYEIEVRHGADVRCLPSGTLDISGSLYAVDRIFFTIGRIP